MKRLNGIKLPHLKGTQLSDTIKAPLPKKVIIPMSMSMGAPAVPLVKVGDEVTAGQKIGESDGAFSLPVHSSVSGKVTAITESLQISGRKCKAIEIEVCEEQKLCEEIKAPEINSKQQFIDAIKSFGICGFGGAGFPTHIKLSPKNEIDTLIINAAECEPYITSDCREILEFPDEIIGGIELILKWLEIPKAVIAIESNKPEAIALMSEKTADKSNIEVFSLPEKYPQGAEKVIIYSVTGRIVTEGSLPSDVNVIVINVSTCSAIKRCCDTGIPIIKRRVTIEGDAVMHPCNIEAYIGTPASELLEMCDTNFSKAKRIVFGGLMMGSCQLSADSPVTKTTNAVLAISKIPKKNKTACIRCGRCVAACPLKLMPTNIEKAYAAKDIAALKKLNVTLCMNCGSCTYVCPASRNLAETNQLAKAIVPKE